VIRVASVSYCALGVALALVGRLVDRSGIPCWVAFTRQAFNEQCSRKGLATW
jgi:hypothetical protein